MLALTFSSYGASVVLQQFNGLTFSDPYTSTNPVPPDPYGAVGPNGVLASVNLALAYYPKTGTNRAALWEVPLANNLVSSGTNSFWFPNAGFTGNGLSDPKVVFDLDSQRFFVVMQENPAGANQSYMNLAVSRRADPGTATSADWLFYRFGLSETWSLPLGQNQVVGLDYPGLAVDRRVLMVAYNAFALSQSANVFNGAEEIGSRVFIFNKAKLLASVADIPRVWENQPPFDFPELDFDTKTVQPVQPIGNADTGNRTFAVELHHEFPYLDNNWSIRLHVFNDPLGSFFYQYDDIPINAPNGDPGGAPQPNGPAVDTVAQRPISACFFANRVWTVYTQKGSSGNAVVHWVAVEPRTKDKGGSFLFAEGVIDGGPGVWTYMPAISAGPYGDICLIYTQSSGTQLPTIYYQMLPLSGQGSGVLKWEPPVLLQASLGPDTAFQASKNASRWGDYAAVATDPVDNTFWVTHEYIDASGTNLWTTFWAQLVACVWPAIAFQPRPLVTNLCATAAQFDLSILADNDHDPNYLTTGPIYQKVYVDWTRNGVSITPSGRLISASNSIPAGAGEQLTILQPGYSDEGVYQAIITGPCGTNYSTKSQSVPLLIQDLPTWTEVQTVIRPQTRYDHSMVYDEARGVCVLFGGALNPQFQTNDTWTWDGKVWVPEDLLLGKAINPPPPRSGHAMAYDKARKRVVLFGGQSFNPGNNNLAYGDTWEWDGTQWQLMAPSGPSTPPGRAYASMAYDSVRQETLLIGGNLVNRDDRIKTWAWNGTNWTLRSTNFPTRYDTFVTPDDVDYGNAMAFDERRGRMVLFGPFLSTSGNRMMEWGGEDWLPIDYKNPVLPIRTNSSSWLGVIDSRYCTAFYDASRGMVACAGGGVFNKAIWYWDGADFFGLDTQIEGVPADSFPQEAGVAFDRQRRVIVWSGGLANYIAHEPHHTREIHFTDTPIVIQEPASVDSDIGQDITLHAAVSGGGALSYQWFFNGQAMTTKTNVTGVNTPTLSITSAGVADSGLYYLNVSGNCGSVKSKNAQVRVGPILTVLQNSFVPKITWISAKAVLQGAATPAGPWVSLPAATSPFVIPLNQAVSSFYRLVAP